MKIIYTTDVHSNKNYFIKLRELVYEVKADILIFGGDLFAHTHNFNNNFYLLMTFKRLHRSL